MSHRTSSNHQASMDYERSIEGSPLPVFVPTQCSLDDIRRSIPDHLFQRSKWIGVVYLLRDFGMAAFLGAVALRFESILTEEAFLETWGRAIPAVLRWLGWCFYWWFQGLVFTGIWAIGHECGHGNVSSNALISDIAGYIAHTVLWTPYFTWKISHHLHHIHHGMMEGDDVYRPKTRSQMSLPSRLKSIDYEDYFGDTPIYTLLVLLVRQFFTYPIYVGFHITGHKLHWQWAERGGGEWLRRGHMNAVILSNIGIAGMLYAMTEASARWGVASVVKFYGIPWLLVSHWFMTISYLHHTDPVIPRYRRKVWSFARGAACTIDRDFLGWYGRFFLHGAAHYHVVHHFFPRIPFYHAEEATRYLKAFLGEYYHYSDKNVLRALWDNYNDCQFVEDDDDIMFYKNKKGEAVMRPPASLASPYESL